MNAPNEPLNLLHARTLLADGYSRLYVAAHLGCSPTTLRKHLRGEVRPWGRPITNPSRKAKRDRARAAYWERKLKGKP